VSTTHADDERLSRAFREPPRGLPRADGCPAPDRLRAAVALEALTVERRAVLDHVAICPACAVAWSVVLELDATAPRVRRSRLATVSTLAAAVVLATALAGLLRPTPDRAVGSVWRRTAPAFDWSAAPGDVTLGTGSTALRWPAGPDGTRYDVRIADSDLVTIDRAFGIDRPEYAVPVERLADLEPGAILLWQVEAVLPDGTRHVSPTFSATWAPSQP